MSFFSQLYFCKLFFNIDLSIMRFFIITLLSLSYFLSPLQLSAQNVSKFGLRDLFEMQYVSSPAISKNGKQIAYVRNSFDVMTDKMFTNIWIVDTDGKNHYPITSGKNSNNSPVWSPDDSRFVFVSNEEGGSQIFMHWINNGTTASLTNLTRSPRNITWSADGQYLAFIMNVPDTPTYIGNIPSAPKGANWAKPTKAIDTYRYRSDGNLSFAEPGDNHIFIVSSNGGSIRQLTSGKGTFQSISWSADGMKILASADLAHGAYPSADNVHLYEINIKDGAISQLSEGKGPYRSASYSPDQKNIVYTHYDNKYLGYQQDELFVMDVSGKNKRKINHKLDRDLSRIQWSNDSKGFFTTYTDQGSDVISYIQLNGKVDVLASDAGGAAYGRPYSGAHYSVSNDGTIAYTHSTPYRPAALKSISPAPMKKENSLVDLSKNFLSSKQLGRVEEIWYSSSFDDLKVHGWIVYPPDFSPEEKYPLILEIHGGPHTAYGPHFSPEVQLMAARGYIVLYTNPRGSTSYGADFASYINHNYPSQDYDDLMSGVDALIARGFIDESRLYITGGSGGGVLTSWSIGKTNRFAAAVVSKPVINWYSFSLYADNYFYYVKNWFNKLPWEDPAQFLDRSPISLVGNVRTPTMVITGEQDYRTPIAESEQYYGALKILGVESMLVRIPETSHSITSRPSNMMRHVANITDWFEKYKKE
jgi:dipeptidyl aminopeptidase/acylaminoacyl peptidase